MRAREHWDAVYQRKDPRQVSWYRPHLEQSLRFIEAAGLGPGGAILDVGGGASTLVDDLCDRGYRDVTVLDVSDKAIATAQSRLGERAAGVRWLCTDVTEVELAAAGYDQEGESLTEMHTTPSGSPQQFTYCYCRRRDTR